MKNDRNAIYDNYNNIVDALKEYVGTDEYIESVAKEKLGLVHENEILFKEQE